METNLLGKRLKELREGRNLKLKDVAKALDLTVSAFSNYEQGLREPSLETFKKICDFYDVSADYLLGRIDEYYQNKTYL